MSVLRVLALGLVHWRRAAAAAIAGFATVASGVGLLGCAAFLIASAAFHPSIAELQVAIVGVRFFGIVRSLARYLERLLSHRVSLDLLCRLRVWFYSALEPLAPARTLDKHSGDLLVRSVDDVESLQELYVRALAPPAVALAVVTGTAMLLCRVSPPVALAVLALHLAGGLLLPLILVRLGRRPGQRLVAARADLGATVVEALDGMEDLIALGADRAHLDRLDRLSREHAMARAAHARLAATRDALGLLLAHAAVLAVLVLAIPMVRSAEVNGVSLAVMALVALASFEAIQPLPAAAQHLEEHRRAAARVLEVVDAEPAVQEPAAPAPIGAGTPSIELCAIVFHHPGRASARPTLADISLTLAPGARVAVVGPSGAGKSTLARLILRYWDPDRGSILVAGRDVRHLSLSELRRAVGLLDQRPHLFSTSVRDNLLLARPEAGDRELLAALADARLDLSTWPAGLDTMIGADGRQLSGGQRQRLAVARLLLQDARVLILDEPTAHLDALTEQELLRTLGDDAADRTVLTITHRLTAMQTMDEILVLDHGRIVERGRHHQLLERGGLYRRLWQAQRLDFGSKSASA